ncbi:hypothetical protein LEP1GSC018_0496 [Leptospira kirschneri str. 2008720114]|nr:hypothetical protein LEP1GSC018_0496 [Leptospira kirschneri str. 2008720114]EKR24643.1 hypothetical protein LEP1GSC087_1700 [Leptospira interrogans serovar Bataviae str. L1111]EMN73842.1 hypothetical protein LEP1GSC100_3880 [Leptospira interrogans serovar Bataviae str. UI 08561]
MNLIHWDLAESRLRARLKTLKEIGSYPSKVLIRKYFPR